MKILTLFILSLLVSFNTYAGDFQPVFVVSPLEPRFGTGSAAYVREGHTPKLWEIYPFRCEIYSDNKLITYNGNIINVIMQSEPIACILPPGLLPYMEVTELSQLAKGSYTINFYSVNSYYPFPPSPQNYPDYFVTSIPFEVLGAPPVIDASSNISLILLGTLMLLSAWARYLRKHKDI